MKEVAELEKVEEYVFIATHNRLLLHRKLFQDL